MNSKREPDSDYTIGPAFVTEKKAVELVRSFLPESEWLWRRQDPDFFVDYNVETVEGGQPTGFQFAIQIKGTNRTLMRRGFVRFPMVRKHLRYYRDSARLPVFVLLADVDRKQVYWLFAQRYLRERAESAQLDKQSTLTLKFDRKDALSNINRFREVLKGAEKYIRDLFPGSPAASVAHRKESLQRLDPDIPVSVSVDENGKEVLRLNPTTPFTLTFGSRDMVARQRFQDTIRRGEMFSAEMELLNPPASPLVRELMKASRYEVRFEPNSRPGTIQMAWKQLFLTIEGAWKGGTEQMRFTGSLLRTPLAVQLTIDRVGDSEFRFSADTPLKFEIWSGQFISHLPWFDELRDLIGTLAAGGEVTINYFVEGQRAGTGILSFAESEVNERIYQTFERLGRIRSLAQHYGIDVELPQLTEITLAKEQEIDALWALTYGNSFIIDIPGARFDCTVSSMTPFAQRLLGTQRRKHKGSVQIFGTSAFDLLGQEIQLHDVQNIFSAVELTEVERISETSRRLKFVGSNRAKWLRRVRPAT